MSESAGVVRPMSDADSSAIRGGQVIGSLGRAVEELVRNAVIHGRAKSVVVTVGADGSSSNDSTPYLEVSDDGIGIEPESLRKYVGTDHCSSSSSFTGRSAGESLKALASLCVEMRVTTTTSVHTAIDKAGKRKSHKRAARIVTYEKIIRESAPASFRSSEGPESTSSSILPGAMRDGPSTLGSNKRVRKPLGSQLSAFSLSSRSSYAQVDPATRTGTTFAILGLFYRYAVRRRHREKSDKGVSSSDGHTSSSSSERADLFQVRSCLRVLALAYPLVAFRLRNGRTGTVDATWEAPPVESWPSSSGVAKTTPRFDPSLPLSTSSFGSLGSLLDARLVTSSLARRLGQLCGNGRIDRVTVPIVYEEEFVSSTFRGNRSRTLSSDSSATANSLNEGSWTVLGTLSFCARKEDGADEGEEAHTKTNRVRQHEMIFVNKRPARHGFALADIVQSELASYVTKRENDSYAYFVLHVTCPSHHVDLVVEENRATLVIPQRDRIECLLRKAVSSTMANNGFSQEKESLSLTRMRSFPSYRSLSRGEPPIIEKSKNTEALTMRTFSSRIISGKSVGSTDHTLVPSSPYFDALERKSDQNTLNKVPPSSNSPFSDAFFDQPVQLPTEQESPADVSFEDAFLSPSAPTTERCDISSDSTQESDLVISNELRWTRTRVRALETQISSLAVRPMTASFNKAISLSKEMISSAQIIAQVDAKFIVIIAGGLVCVVDQHAADERVGLERLERTLREETTEKPAQIGSTGADTGSSPLLKSVPLLPAQSIRMSSTQLATVCHHQDLLEKWKFAFKLPSNENEMLLLSGVPGVCDKIATRQDFLQFVQALDNHTSDAALVKPAFVKRVLASHACRFAIMFGDTLSHQRCVDLLRSLSDCNLPFVCAHGRPSVIPLVDMGALRSKDDSRRYPMGKSLANGFGRVPLRLQSQTVISKKYSSASD